MSSRPVVPPLLDDATAAFIQGGVSMSASSRTADNLPVTARAVGCRVSADRRSITVLFETTSAQDLLDGIRDSRQIAFVCSLPSTHQTVQLKGKDATIAPAAKKDILTAEAYCDAFVAEIRMLGYAEPLIRALVWFDPESLAAVTFNPGEAFLQTPGPRAGERLTGEAHAHSG